MRKRTLATLFLLALVAVPASGQEKSDKAEWVSGVVVAYDAIEADTPCYRSCDRSLLVRVSSAAGKEARYIRVAVRIEEEQNFPRELIANKRLWQFKVTRTARLDEPLYEYLVQNATASAGEKKYPIWKLIPGAEGEKLPFNEKISSYSTTRNGFKAVRD